MKTIIQLNDIHKSYGAQVILDGASLTITEGQKIGVIGRNGSGKSTLCNIITGKDHMDSGRMRKSAGFRLAYLEQHDPYKLDESVIDFLQRYTGKEECQCGKVAARFQLKNELLTAEIGGLPGGYRTRVKLASMLLTDPNFLIMDEPSNYLDLKTLILLEEFLLDYRGGFLIVSHDREFLKKTCKHTLEIERGAFKLYPGNVERFLLFKEEQKEQAISYNKGVTAKQKQLQQFVDRFGAKASKASQARSKMKQIGKLQTIEVGHSLGNVHIKIPHVDKKNALALATTDLEVGYPDSTVAGGINIDVFQGAHVAVLGDNGQGKTTFLRTIAEDLDSKSGSYKWGYGLKVGYYAQHVFTTLDPKITVYDHLFNSAASSVTQQQILNFAGSFLFRGDDVKKKIKVLSGGERARLCLAGLLLTKSQVLLLDEPTNHLDFETVEALGEALKSFNGTLFFVSHDRTFVNLVTTEIIRVDNGMVGKYMGSYEEYVYRMEKNVQDEFKNDIGVAQKSTSGAHEARKTRNGPSPKSSYHLKKELKTKKVKLNSLIRKTEKRLSSLKEEYTKISQDMFSWSPAEPETNMEERYRLLHKQNARYEQLKALISKDEDLWLELHEKHEVLIKKIEAL